MLGWLLNDRFFGFMVLWCCGAPSLGVCLGLNRRFVSQLVPKCPNLSHFDVRFCPKFVAEPIKRTKMKKDLAFSLLVFCLTLITNFVMEHDHDFPDGKSLDVEKTAYRSSEMIRERKYYAPPELPQIGIRRSLTISVPLWGSPDQSKAPEERNIKNIKF